jgi:hypothetical protein
MLSVGKKKAKSKRATPTTSYTKTPTNTMTTHRASSSGRRASGGSIDEALLGVQTRSAEKKKKEEDAAQALVGMAALSKGSDSEGEEDDYDDEISDSDDSKSSARSAGGAKKGSAAGGEDEEEKGGEGSGRKTRVTWTREMLYVCYKTSTYSFALPCLPLFLPLYTHMHTHTYTHTVLCPLNTVLVDADGVGHEEYLDPCSQIAFAKKYPQRINKEWPKFAGHLKGRCTEIYTYVEVSHILFFDSVFTAFLTPTPALTPTPTPTPTPIHTHREAQASKDPETKKYLHKIHSRATKQLKNITADNLQSQFQQKEREKGGETDMGGGIFIPTMAPPKSSALTKHIATQIYFRNLYSVGMSGAGASRHCKTISDQRKDRAMQATENNGGRGSHGKEVIMTLAQQIPNDRLLRDLCEMAYRVKEQRQQVAASAKKAANAKALATASKKQQTRERRQRIDLEAFKLVRVGVNAKAKATATTARAGHTSRLSGAMMSEAAGAASGGKQNGKKRKKQEQEEGDDAEEEEGDDEEEEKEESEGDSADKDGDSVVIVDNVAGANNNINNNAVIREQQQRAEEKARAKTDKEDPLVAMFRQQMEDRKEERKQKADRVATAAAPTATLTAFLVAKTERENREMKHRHRQTLLERMERKNLTVEDLDAVDLKIYNME